MKLAVVILAAGKGTRMKSDMPKALHSVCGRPMLGHLLAAAKTLNPQKIVVVAGFQAEQIRKFVGSRALIAQQRELLGSGHAVLQAQTQLKGFKGRVLIAYCDTPFISAETLSGLMKVQDRDRALCAIATAVLDEPRGYGRIIRNSDASVQSIVEETDASPAQAAIREINVGCYAVEAQALFRALSKIKPNSRKKEYYLTDIVELLAQEGRVSALQIRNLNEMQGVNSQKDLADMNVNMQRAILDKWMEQGVVIRDPGTVIVDVDVKIGRGTVLHPHTVIEEGSVIGENCQIGPFARIRGGSVIEDGAVVGNFVEVVRSRVGKRSQAKHLAYLGDTEVGERVNIGAGTITANYDGKNKHKTVIKDGAFIGSGTILIAPVTVGRDARTGAGAVVTRGRHVPDKSIVVGIPAKVLNGKKGLKKK